MNGVFQLVSMAYKVFHQNMPKRKRKENVETQIYRLAPVVQKVVNKAKIVKVVGEAKVKARAKEGTQCLQRIVALTLH